MRSISCYFASMTILLLRHNNTSNNLEMLQFVPIFQEELD